jgi:signal transduction histidine kinase
MENKRKHLEMIQGVVNRLAQSSFLLKGWSVVLVSALFALAASGSQPLFIYLAYFPAIAFWILDGYFLWQERLFRALYDRVRGLKEEEIDFSMDTSLVRHKVAPWRDVILSKTLIIFHGTLICSIVIVMLVVILLPIGEQ